MSQDKRTISLTITAPQAAIIALAGKVYAGEMTIDEAFAIIDRMKRLGIPLGCTCNCGDTECGCTGANAGAKGSKHCRRRGNGCGAQ